MPKRKKASDPPNPTGRNGKPLRIPLDFDEAVKAALETPPPKPAKKASKTTRRTAR
jgi:hypothetical protein